MSLWKRGNVYWSYLTLDGIRYAQSTGTGNQRQAREIEQRFRDELNRKRYQLVEPRPHMTVGELAARFLAEGSPRPWHIDRLKPLLSYWSAVPIGRIHKSMATDYRRHRHAEKVVTDTTINRDLEALRHILFWALDEGLLLANPLTRLHLVQERRKPRSILSVEDETRLLAASAPHLRHIVIAALDTGMRRGELLHQRWEHIDWYRRLLSVTQSKTAGGEGREIPFTERIASLLQRMQQDEGLLFTFKGKPVHAIKTAWKAAIRRSGIRYLRLHDLRHTFNTRLMEAGVMQEIRKALMGHSSGEDVNSIYTHVELPAKREAIRKLEAWIETETHRLSQHAASGETPRTSDGNTNPTPAMEGQTPHMKEKLKLVILYDARNNSYMVSNHNLAPEEAEVELGAWREKGLNAMSIDQRTRHRVANPQACRACRNDVARSSGLTPKPTFEKRSDL